MPFYLFNLADMQFGICVLSLVPLRKEPSGSSEMVSQLLFGELYTVLEINGDWIKIKTQYDHYECWLSEKQHTAIQANTFKLIEKQDTTYTAEPIQVVHNKKDGSRFPLCIGAALPNYKNQHIEFENFKFEFEGSTQRFSHKKTISELISTSYLFLNAPYMWGGKSPFGIDCSGFTQLVYKLSGYKLPRDAYQQVELGSALSFVEEAEAGDLAFFDNEEGQIVHVGIVLDTERIIHASGFVKIDHFDHYGIFNKQTKKYSHTLRVIKRII
jgi:gamma-D-glutamyl-L-lysine dipeptidyl-peptidase